MGKSNKHIANKELEEIRTTATNWRRELSLAQDDRNIFINGNENNPSLEDIQKNMRDISEFQGHEYQENIKKIHDEVNDDLYPDIEEIYERSVKSKREMFGHSKKETEVDEEGAETVKVIRVPGIVDDIKSLKSDAEKQIQEQNKKYNELYNDLEKLMGASAAAGLGKNYREQADDGHGKALEKAKKWFSIYIGAITVIIILNFVLPDQVLSRVDWWQSTLRLFTLTAPLIWLAYTENKNIHVQQRLQAEYKHKETFCTTYTAIQERVEDIEDEDLHKKFLDKMIEVNAYNPCGSIDTQKAEMPIEKNYYIVYKSFP